MRHCCMSQIADGTIAMKTQRFLITPPREVKWLSVAEGFAAAHVLDAVARFVEPLCAGTKKPLLGAADFAQQ